MKILGTTKYKFGAGSPTDALALGYNTMVEAQNHANKMNKSLKLWPSGNWNIEYWEEKPESWIAFESEDCNYS